MPRITRPYRTLFTFLAATVLPAAGAMDRDAVRSALLDGVETIHSGSQPGRMIVYGPDSVAVANYEGGPAEGPVIAAAVWGKGRVIAMPDHQMLNMDSYGEKGDSGRFYRNALAWLAGSTEKSIRVASTGHSGIGGWLRSQGYTNVTKVDRKKAGTGDDLERTDVLVGWLGTSVSKSELSAIAKFVKGGGGLFLCEYGVGYQWWWKRPVHEAPGNVLLRDVGIAFTPGHRWDRDLLKIKRASGHTTPETVLNVLKEPAAHPRSVRDQAAQVMNGLYSVLPPGTPLIAELDAAFRGRVNQINPTPKTRVTDPFEKALLNRELALLNRVPVSETTAHRTAEAVYGTIPVDAKRVTRRVSIDTSRTRWHSTGLYAAPGDRITVTVPAHVAGKGYHVQVSGHVDSIAHKGSWLRMPRVSRRYKLEAEATTVASPFGGALYVDTTPKPRVTPDFEAVFAGAIEAPWFVLGQTTDAQWRDEQRHRPGPFAELCSDHLCISLPARAVRDLEAVSGLMTFWDRTVACQDDLAGHGNLRTCAERINIDVQISAGGAHAGYPAQGPGIWGLNDVEHLRTNGTWGWFHELGHEAQRRPDKSWGYGNPYTFNGSTEATVNLFSTYARDTHGIRAPGGWGWTSYPDRVMKRAREAVDKGGYTKVDVGRKLAMFLQIRDGFGWQAWKQVLRSYNREAKEQPSELPKTDAAKRDQFLIRFSNVTGHNLTRFLRDFWKLDFSPGAIEQVRQLPDWMPAVGGIDRATVAAGDSFVLPLQEEALSLDGTARITAVGKPGHGQLKLTGEGKWSYTPIRGFEGDDTFSYTVSSSTGHTHTTDVTVAVRADGAWLDTWRGVPGVAIANLTGDKRYPDAPDQRTIVDSLEVSPTNLDNYGARLRALLVPPASGLYTFWIASDDAGALYLSNDDQPGGRRCIARVSGYTAKRAWDAAPEQKSAALKLERGRSYYLEALVKEGGGSDHLSVAWQGPDIERQVIPNSCLKLPPR